MAMVICWADVPRVKIPSEMNPGDIGKMHPVKMDTSDLIFLARTDKWSCGSVGVPEALMDLQNEKRHLGLLHSTVHPLHGRSPSWTGCVAGTMGGL